MKRSELTEFAVEDEGFKLKIRRGGNGLPLVSQGSVSNPPFATQPETALPQVVPQAATLAETAHPKDEAGVDYIKSPMVGTFYSAVSPESKVFVEADSKVSPTTVICIIEAMKIMNEIQAETKGTIIEALVENGQPVEYGQRLFKIKQG